MCVLVLSSMVVFTACKDKDDDEKDVSTSKIMNLSLNPEIELILDKDNKVVSVNAINHEGNYIIANADFVGLTAENAVNLFLKTTNESGFIISGDVNVDENQLKIAISGDEAETIFNALKTSISDYAEELNIEVNVPNLTKLSEDYLESLVEDCMREVNQSQIANLDEEQLISLIKTSREETKNFFSQELKELFYQTRAEEIVKARITAISEIITEQLQSNPILANLQFDLNNDGTMESGINDFKNLIESKKGELETTISAFKNKYKEIYETADGDYQKALEAYLQAKQDLLQARVNNVVDLSEYEEIVNKAHIDFYGDELGKDSNANTAIVPKYKAEIESFYNQGISIIKENMNSVISMISQFINETEIQEKIAEEYITHYNLFLTEIGNNVSDIESRKNFWNILEVEQSV